MSESLDFQYPMKKACANEIKQMCADVAPANAQQIRCLQVPLPPISLCLIKYLNLCIASLQEHVEDPDMGSACKQEVQRQAQRQSTDYRLNFRLHRSCEVDVDELCADVCSPFQGQACGGTVLRCLTEKRDEVCSPYWQFP